MRPIPTAAPLVVDIGPAVASPIARRSAGALRAPRALALAFPVVAVSLAGHRIGGGDNPAVAPFVLTVMATVPVAWWAARARPGAARTVALLGASQVVFHVVFQATAPAVPHAHPGGAGHHDAGHGWPMVTGHALATVLLAAVVTWADDLVARVLDALRLLVRAAGGAGPVAREALVPAMPPRRPLAATAPATGGLDPRGPPRA
jgi:hypothetical protein